MRAVSSPGTKSTLGQKITLTRLAPQQTGPAQPKVRELEMPMLVNKQVIWFQITVNARESEPERVDFASDKQNSPMNDTPLVQVPQTQYNLGNIILGPLFRQ